MYLYGGGWNEADDGAGEEAVTIGVSSRWQEFFQQQNENYYYHQHFCRSDGLDCSGYVGWVLYNVMQKENGKAGYVLPARRMAQTFAANHWGTYRAAADVTDYKAGDIMSSDAGHVYIVIGECADGSVVLLHSSPPGVMLSGTYTKDGKSDSAALSLAKYYLKTYYPAWYEKFPLCARDTSYLTEYNQMRWDLNGILRDPDGYRALPPPLILANIIK